MVDKLEILSLLEGNAEHLRTFGLRRIGLFGSFVRGDERPDSDIDFLAEFDASKKTFDNFIQAAFFLEDLLGKPVELIT